LSRYSASLQQLQQMGFCFSKAGRVKLLQHLFEAAGKAEDGSVPHKMPAA
jgi:hypothetical protein